MANLLVNGMFSNWQMTLGIKTRAKLGVSQLKQMVTVATRHGAQKSCLKDRAELIKNAVQLEVSKKALECYPGIQFPDIQLSTSDPLIRPQVVEYQGMMFVLSSLGFTGDVSKADQVLDLVETAREQGAPLAAIMPTEQGQRFFICHNSPFILSEYMPGESVSANAASQAHIESAISAFNDLHVAFFAVEPSQKEKDMFRAKEIGNYERFSYEWQNIQDHIAGAKYQHQSWTKLLGLSQLIDECIILCLENRPIIESLPLQYVHGDAHIRNVLFEGEKVSAIIDYGKIAVGRRFSAYARFLIYAGIDGFYFSYDRAIMAARYLLNKGYIKQDDMSLMPDFFRMTILQTLLDYWPRGHGAWWGRGRNEHHSFLQVTEQILIHFNKQGTERFMADLDLGE